MLSILTDIWVRVQKEKQNHEEIHIYEGIYYRALALLNCASWLNSTWSLWLLCLVQKPEVSRAGSHGHAEVKQGQDGTARIIRICKGGPEPASPPLSASPLLSASPSLSTSPLLRPQLWQWLYSTDEADVLHQGAKHTWPRGVRSWRRRASRPRCHPTPTRWANR